MKCGMLMLCCCGLLTLATPPAWGRKWTDATGMYSVEAELVKIQGQNAVLRKPDGSVITVPIARLSATDRAYASQHDQTHVGDDGAHADLPLWTMNLAKMKIPNTPVRGRIHGRPFHLAAAKLKQDSWLTLRQGKDFFPDLAIDIVLFLKAGERLAGHQFRVMPESGYGGPHVILKWRVKPGEGVPESKTFMSQYALLLQFGKPTGGKLPGRVYLCLKDDQHSVVAGTFTVQVAADGTRAHATAAVSESGTISGLIRVPRNGEGLRLWVGCLGQDPKGSLESPAVGIDLRQTGGTMSCTTWKPRNTSVSWNKKTRRLTHQHSNRPPGRYLVYVRENHLLPHGELECQGYFDWKWVDLTATKPNATVNLTVDPSRLGTLEVTVVGPTKETAITYIPLDEAGAPPPPQVHYYWQDASAAKLTSGKTLIKGLREGTYQVGLGPWQRGTGAPSTTANVTVMRGTTVKVELNAPARKP